jgi:hypothetical protein
MSDVGCQVFGSYVCNRKRIAMRSFFYSLADLTSDITNLTSLKLFQSGEEEVAFDLCILIGVRAMNGVLTY